jgi:carboxymethylenebutenolidase
MRPQDVTLDDGTPGYAAAPDGATRGAVVLHELYGRMPEIDRVVERFARHGYAAVAPDLFSSGWKINCLRQAVHDIARGEGPMIDKIRGARAWLAEAARLDEQRIGLIGFCIGGSFALAAGRGWGAISTNYGGIPKDELLRGLGPTIGCYGGRDVVFGKMAPTLERKLRAAGVEVETHTYPNVGHSFLTDGDHPVGSRLSWPLLRISYDPAVAEEAWTKILAFFDGHL